MYRRAAALGELDERHSDRPTIPASADDLPMIEAHNDPDATTKVESAAMLSGATVRARVSDFRALLEAERKIADTARSGVRAIAPEVAAHKAASAAPSVMESMPPPVAAFPVAAHVEARAPVPADAPPATSPVKRSGRARKVIAGLLFAIVMAGALGLLGVAMSRKGLLHLPQTIGLHR